MMIRWLRDNKDMVPLIAGTIAVVLVILIILGIAAINEVNEIEAFKEDCAAQSGLITETKHRFTHVQGISNGKTTTWIPMNSSRTTYLCVVNGEVVGSHP